MKLDGPVICTGPTRDLDGWDNLFNMFVECGEDWMKCDLVTQNKSVREQSRTGSWALMSKVVAHLKGVMSNYSLVICSFVQYKEL